MFSRDLCGFESACLSRHIGIDVFHLSKLPFRS